MKEQNRTQYSKCLHYGFIQLHYDATVLGFQSGLFTVIPCSPFPFLPPTGQWADGCTGLSGRTSILLWEITASSEPISLVFFHAMFLNCRYSWDRFIVLLRTQKRGNCCLSPTCVTGYFRHIQQLAGTYFNVVIYNLPHNYGALFMLKFFTEVACQLKNLPRSFTLSWIASSATGRIMFTFQLARASWLCSLMKDKIFWFETYIPHNLVF